MRPLVSLWLIFIALLWISWPAPASAQVLTSTPEPGTPAVDATLSPEALPAVSTGISTPQTDALLTGLVTVIGSTNLPGATGWDLAFTYTGDTTGTWFPISASVDPINQASLGDWDTALISDGFYTLRLRIFTIDASAEYTVAVRVANETPLETATPTPTATARLTATAQSTLTATVTPLLPPETPILLTSTPFPPNPASLGQAEILLNLAKGALGVLVVFLVVGLMLSLNNRLRS